MMFESTAFLPKIITNSHLKLVKPNGNVFYSGMIRYLLFLDLIQIVFRKPEVTLFQDYGTVDLIQINNCRSKCRVNFIKSITGCNVPVS